MANKKVYFNAIEIFDITNKEVPINKLKEIYKDIFDSHSIKSENEGYNSLSLSTGENRVTLDILDNDNEYLFCRVGKRKDDNSMLVRDYDTYKDNDVLTPKDSLKKGVEMFTYFLLNYSSGIFSIVSTQSAPTESILNRIVSQYNNYYRTEIVSIPNSESIKNLYTPGSSISRVALRLPIPSPQYLEEVLELDKNEILSLLQCDIKELTLEVRGEYRKPLTSNDSKIKKVINAAIKTKDNYNGAIIRGKTPESKTQNYDLKSQLFSYLIDVRIYNIENSEKVYLSIDELANEYHTNLLFAYKTNKDQLLSLVNRY